MEIGKKVKALRIQHGLTQEELANRCELSKGFISMVENDLTSPSVSTMNDLLEVLGVSMYEFFALEDQNKEVVHHKNDYFTKQYDHSTVEFLVSNAQARGMEPLKVIIEPSGMSNEILPHEGEMFGYVLKGKVQLVLEDTVYLLNSGDSFYLDKPTTSQKLVNRSKDHVCEVIWISTPPVF